jgi:single-strand DNA-binding protein
MLNKIILIGNVGRDPETKTTNEGKKLAFFSLATSESWKDKNSGERKSITEWHQIVIFNEKIAEFCKNYVKKGSKLCIEGKNKTRKFQYKNEEKERSVTEIIIDYDGKILLLDSKNETVKSFYESKEERENKDIDDIPF